MKPSAVALAPNVARRSVTMAPGARRWKNARTNAVAPRPKASQRSRRVHHLRGSQILERSAYGLEQGDLRRAGAPSLLAPAQLGQFRPDVGSLHDTRSDRLYDVTSFGQSACKGVDEHRSFCDELVVGLAHRRRKTAHQIDMRAGPHVHAVHDRQRSRGRAGHDVGLRECLGQVSHRDCVLPLRSKRFGERACLVRSAPPYQNARKPPHSRMGGRHVGRKLPGADHEQRPALRSRQKARSERGCGRGAAQRQRFAIDERERMAGHAVEQHVGRGHGRHPARCVFGEGGDDLHAERFALAPRRHQEKPRVLVLVHLVRVP